MKLINPTGIKRIIVGKNEKLDVTLQDFNEGSREFTLEIELQGDNAQCRIQGRAQSTGKDKKIWTVSQTFSGTNQTGQIELRGTAEDESFLQFDGTALLSPSSVDADANINERIILFDNAKGKLLPVLTVKTDRVKSASHGASIAPVDSEKFLYLQSRGIAKKEGEQLLKEGFLK
ncbi:SufD family Fe-S cluster assembly protein [Candidatus Gracilibacteria bacterium]|nr:SufD family Fe-S cluster assembly protein [Candidatus Gracilibacteria bacterium]